MLDDDDEYLDLRVWRRASQAIKNVRSELGQNEPPLVVLARNARNLAALQMAVRHIVDVRRRGSLGNLYIWDMEALDDNAR